MSQSGQRADATLPEGWAWPPDEPGRERPPGPIALVPRRQVRDWLNRQLAVLAALDPPDEPADRRETTSSRRRQPQRKSSKKTKAGPSEDTWWRTLSDRESRCDGCKVAIAPGDRFLYRHSPRAVRCRKCGAAIWDDARVSKRLRAAAIQRRAA